jgi:hypothetical protein
MAVFIFPQVNFEYPDILRQLAGYVLERFAAGGNALVTNWHAIGDFYSSRLQSCCTGSWPERIVGAFSWRPPLASWQEPSRCWALNSNEA